MAKVKVINKNINEDLIGNSFTNVASETIFSFGNFNLDTNFSGKQTIDYSNELSNFVTPITLESLALSDTEAQKIFDFTTNATLSFDRSDLKNFVKFGSTRELLRVSLQNIILNYPASLFIDSTESNCNIIDYYYDPLTDKAQFKTVSAFIQNIFGLIFNYNNTSIPEGNKIKNINLSYYQYVIWRKDIPEDNTHYLLGYTGDTPSNSYIYFIVQGNPFPEITGVTTTGNTAYNIKPEPLIFNKFKSDLQPIEQHILGNRNTGQTGFLVYFKEPTLLDNGDIIYTDRRLTWPTVDGYNINTSSGVYNRFVDSILNIGEKYDKVKTDIIARLLVPDSIQTYDLTEEGKIKKLLRIYGSEFDNMRQFIDALVNINTVTYNKKNDVPTQLVKNLAKNLGWDIFSLVDADLFSESFFSSEKEFNEGDIIPSEIDIELWRRIILNTNYFWKAKGTRHALNAILLLIGIPKQFINITEYIYTVDGKIDPNSAELSLSNLPSSSLPYNTYGYPIAPKETNDFYFQISGTTDGGQAYINLYRNVGFNLNRIVDNKKSWVETGYTERIHYTTPNYFQQDSQLIINTKEIDATLDIAQAIEYDVYSYNKNIDDPITSSGITKPYIYINVPFDYNIDTNIFTIPDTPLTGSSIQINFNGITLTSGDTGIGDYLRTGAKQVTLNTETAKIYTNGTKDIITITYLFDRLGSTGYTDVKYVVQALTINPDGVTITLPEEPKGDVQLVVNGITMSKGNSLFTGDFIINPINRTQIIVQNTSLRSYLQTNPVVRVWYIKDGGMASNAKKRSEIYRVDSMTSSKFFYHAGIQRYVYSMDYIAFGIDAIKITLNGITLQNGTDFDLNSSNKHQVYLRKAINYGDIIGTYYFINDGSYTPPLLPPDPNFPPISDMTFLEYLELINRRLINVKTRKTITDFNGGYYPTIEKIYEEYLKRSYLSKTNLLKSNGYTFEILYPFIQRYNSFFNRFLNQLLSATVIIRKGGVLIRNTVFNKQKFMYRRGVNFNSQLGYLGNDGSEYMKTIPDNGIITWTDDFVCVSIPTTTTTTTTIPPTMPPTTTTTTTSPPLTIYYGLALTITPNPTVNNSNIDGNGDPNNYAYPDADNVAMRLWFATVDNYDTIGSGSGSGSALNLPFTLDVRFDGYGGGNTSVGSITFDITSLSNITGTATGSWLGSKTKNIEIISGSKQAKIDFTISIPGLVGNTFEFNLKVENPSGLFELVPVGYPSTTDWGIESATTTTGSGRWMIAKMH